MIFRIHFPTSSWGFYVWLPYFFIIGNFWTLLHMINPTFIFLGGQKQIHKRPAFSIALLGLHFLRYWDSKKHLSRLILIRLLGGHETLFYNSDYIFYNLITGTFLYLVSFFLTESRRPALKSLRPTFPRLILRKETDSLR